jgi:hypothetical protein
MAALPIARLQWRSAKRIISTRFPSVGILDRLVAPGDLEALQALDARTNPRLRDAPPDAAARLQAGDVGASVIAAPFVHINPNGSRFSDGHFGVFYAATWLRTSIAEVRYHRERFLAATHEAPQTIELMLYEAAIAGEFADIRASTDRGWYDPASYARSQPLGVRLHKAGSDGIVYRSVRDPAGTCLAVFKPALIRRCRPVKPLFAHWNGTAIVAVTSLA